MKLSISMTSRVGSQLIYQEGGIYFVLLFLESHFSHELALSRRPASRGFLATEYSISALLALTRRHALP